MPHATVAYVLSSLESLVWSGADLAGSDRAAIFFGTRVAQALVSFACERQFVGAIQARPEHNPRLGSRNAHA